MKIKIVCYFLCSICLFFKAQHTLAQQFADTVYLPTTESLSKRKTPSWFNEAKLGIFIHWGLYAVPAWAETKVSVETAKDWKYFYKHNPYAEWYMNTLKIKDSPTSHYHKQKYGQQFDYYDFIPIFNQENKQWKPDEWVNLFLEAGAKYIVLTSKHHDGFRLWHSNIPNPMYAQQPLNAERNIVAELEKAARSKGLKFGLYYSGGLDWTFYRTPITNLYPDLFQSKPTSIAYASYAENHLYELIYQFRPDVLWNDISFPDLSNQLSIFSELVNHNPLAVINDRWGKHSELTDFITPEYKVMDTICHQKWETCRGIGYSFGYNQNETAQEMLSPDALIDMFIDIVSKNGNLLLNVGPKADGSIPASQALRLTELGKWLKINGEAIYASYPYHTAGDKIEDGTRIRFTQKPNQLFVFLLEKPNQNKFIIPFPQNLTLAQQKNMKITLLGEKTQSLSFHYSPEKQHIEVLLPKILVQSHAYTIKVAF